MDCKSLYIKAYTNTQIYYDTKLYVLGKCGVYRDRHDFNLNCFMQMRTMEKNRSDLRNAGNPFSIIIRLLFCNIIKC